MTELLDRAAGFLPQLESTEHAPHSVYAGTGFDLTGRMACYHPRCRTDQMHDLIRRTWLYFDRVIATDDLTPRLVRHWEHAGEIAPSPFLAHVELLLNIRELGAEEMIDFRLKPPLVEGWEECWKHAETLGIQGSAKNVKGMIDALKAEATMHVSEDDPDVWWVQHPLVGHMQWAPLPALWAKGRSDEEIRDQVAFQLVRRVSEALVADVEGAKRYGGSYASATPIAGSLIRRPEPAVTAADVALHLRLPYLSDLPLGELLKLREAEADSFHRFRTALRLGATTLITTEGDGRDPRAVAEAVQNDVLQPGVQEIRERMTAAKVVLAQKSAVSAAIGGFTATVGILGGADALAVGGALLSAALEAGPIHGYIDQRKEVQLSDMYFLWKAGQLDHIS